MSKLDHFVAMLQQLLDLRFLPDKLQKWLFSTGTRVIEVLSALIMIGFVIVFLAGGHEVFDVDLYQKFLLVHPVILSSVLSIVAIAQLAAAVFQSGRSNVISGYFLILSALIWALISGTFWAGYPPLSTGMTTYPVLAIVCALAGRNSINYAKRGGALSDSKDGR